MCKDLKGPCGENGNCKVEINDDGKLTSWCKCKAGYEGNWCEQGNTFLIPQQGGGSYEMDRLANFRGDGSYVNCLLIDFTRVRTKGSKWGFNGVPTVQGFQIEEGQEPQRKKKGQVRKSAPSSKDE